MKKIGFAGVGVMGKGMIRNLMKSGFEVYIYSRTKSKCEDIISEGASWFDSPKELAKGKDAIITMLGYPSDVREVYFGENGLIENADKGTVLIDMTTNSPTLAKEIYAEAAKKDVKSLDAPVSGGDVGAKNAALSIMVGGDKEAFDKCIPLFEAMGKKIIYQGKSGNGQHTKMANQIALSGIVVSVAEALSYSKAAGLDIDTMLKSISEGAAGSWQLSNMAPRMLNGDHDPGFFIKHFNKDMRIAAEQAEMNGLNLGILKKALSIYEDMEQNGMGDLGTQAIIRYYEK